LQTTSSLPVSQDAYVTYRGTRRRDYGEPSDPRPVIFVDLDSSDIELLRALPSTYVGQRQGTVLVRLANAVAPAQDDIANLKQLADRWPLLPRVAVLHQPVGEQPHIEVVRGTQLDSDGEPAMLERARAVELEALLELSHAVWRPTNYHYRLISGEHAGAYIKLGDAIREPRDATVLASWLFPWLGPNVGFVFDTGTMTPLAQALRLAGAEAKVQIGATAMLDDYPRTGVDLDAIIDRACGDDGRIVLVLSVSSSGSLLERVLGAVDRKGASLTDPQVIVLVDKSGKRTAGVDTWTPLPGQDPLVRAGPKGSTVCELCQRPGRAPVVPINPFTFDAMLPAQLRRIVPDIQDPSDNRRLWEAAQRTNALAVERPGNDATRRHRSARVPMGIVMRVERLLADAAFRGDVISRIGRCVEVEGMSADADLVLVPEHELTEGFDDFWAAVGPMLAPQVSTVSGFPTSGDFNEALADQIKQASSILIFQLGTVSGATLQQALVGVQVARGGLSDFALQAFVVHMRPATSREWQTIRNSYGKVGDNYQLHAAWKSILPDRSPLREEGALLGKLDLDTFADPEKTFITERTELCKGNYQGDQPAVLWGASAESRLTPNAIYGQRLDAVATYVAVGSAMAAALVDPRTAIPEFRVFEMAAMARSYYDPLILGCFLRWLRPYEVFWGWTATEAKTTALHMLDRAVGGHKQILVPEMLLAAAQGKLTREAAIVAAEAARELLDEEIPADVRAATEVGRRLLGNVEKLQSTDGLFSGSAADAA
jgi:hypothetical protein